MPHNRRKLGRRGDWILRSVGNGDLDEYGVGEATKVWVDRFGTKFLKEVGLKIPKALKDMLIKLMRKANWDSEACAKMRTVGIVHAGLVMMLVTMDRPGGFVCRVLRGELLEVPDREEKLPNLLPILATILNAKIAVQETVKAANVKVPTTPEVFQMIGVAKKFSDSKQRIPECMTTPSKRRRKQ